MATVFKWRSEDPDVLSDEVQRRLAHWNRKRLAPRLPDQHWIEELDRERELLLLENAFLEELRSEVAERAAAAPSDSAGFVAWFEDLKLHGPGQSDPLFPWLAEAATLEELRWYLRQEAAGEAGFDDLTALTQIKLPTRVKLELARNYWDEMGRGNEKGMHGPMLERLIDALEIRPSIETTLWQSLV